MEFLSGEQGQSGEQDQMIGEVLKSFEAWLNQFQLSPGTRALYLGSVRLFLKTTQPSNDNPTTAEIVNTFLKDHPRIYYKAAIKKYLEFRNLNLRLARIKEPARKIRKVPTIQELFAILKKIRDNPSIDRQIYIIFKTAIHTGSRISEIMLLKFGDLRENEIVFPKTKTGVPRVVPMPPAAIKEIRAFASEDVGALASERIFYRNHTTPKSAYTDFREDVLLIKDLTLEEKRTIMKTHNFRRAVINRILELNGGNVTEAQLYIGHGEPGTTIRYLSELQKNDIINRAFKRLVEGGET